MAWAMIRAFYAHDAQIHRTRDAADIRAADIVIDVGGHYDPATRRFDHHQQDYTGPLSAAGMVLEWLEAEGHIPGPLATHLRRCALDYLDDVDNGRVAPVAGVPCFPRIVEFLNQPARSPEDYDTAFDGAADVAAAWLAGMVADHDKIAEATRVVLSAMQTAADAGSNLIELPQYLRWKPVYFANGGADHPTEFVLFPGHEDTWRIVCIPPVEGDFGQKRSLPEAWAGLSDGPLEAAIGVNDAVFCHKNRFIAVFKTRDAALLAMKKWTLLTGPT